ncbi:MAG: asparagine synthase (glutamine-hydrolyzing) [Pseudomonadota bacterium]
MCGIAGIINLAGEPVNTAHLRAMNRALGHRGPDDEGYCLIDPLAGSLSHFAGQHSSPQTRRSLPDLSAYRGQASIGFAHTRFAIVDLTSGGHQPLQTSLADDVITFNGEIYNHVEVRRELTAEGVHCQTNSDTEVFLAAYRHWGPAALARLNGFWAAAIYDGRRKRVLLLRDRLGKKPLLWTRVQHTLYFASEIKALLAIPAVFDSRAVDEWVAYQWLVYGRKNLDQRTFFRNISALAPASLAVVSPGWQGEADSFWSLPTERLRESDISIDDAAAGIRSRLDEAVRQRARADVPVAVELSGGMDSSAIAASAALQADKPLSSYTVRFYDPAFDESGWARQVAERSQLDYREIAPPAGDFWGHVRSFTHLHEEPYHAPNLYTNQLIWSHMRNDGYKVSLNGSGGDESFAGYAKYFAPAQLERLAALDVPAFFRSAFNHSESSNPLASLFSPLARASWNELDEHLLIPLGRKRRAFRQLARHPGVRPGRLLADTLASDMTKTQMPYWLSSGDRNFMGIPLEVRAPLLDYQLVEFAFSLPTTYLFRDGWHKWILRKAFESRLPTDVVWRRTKLGFPFPFDEFARRHDSILEMIIQRASNPWIDLSQKQLIKSTWRIMSFVIWYEHFINLNQALFDDIEQLARDTDSGMTFPPAYFSSCQAGLAHQVW